LNSKGKGEVSCEYGNDQIEMDKIVDFSEQFFPATLYTEIRMIGILKLLQGLTLRGQVCTLSLRVNLT